MVVASFVLNELDSVPTKDGDRPVLEFTLNNLWKSTKSFLVLVERGSPLGSKLIIKARDYILAKGDAQVVAPCPHSGSCPMLGSWCHFSQRLQLPREMMDSMKFKRNVTDCRFSYIILRKKEDSLQPPISLRESHPQNWPRIIVGPNKLKRKVVLDLCTPDGKIFP